MALLTPLISSKTLKRDSHCSECNPINMPTSHTLARPHWKPLVGGFCVGNSWTELKKTCRRCGVNLHHLLTSALLFVARVMEVTIWDSGVSSRKRLLQNIILLWTLNQIPEKPRENHLVSRTDTTHRLTVERENEIVNNLASLSATTKDYLKVMAISFPLSYYSRGSKGFALLKVMSKGFLNLIPNSMLLFGAVIKLLGSVGDGGRSRWVSSKMTVAAVSSASRTQIPPIYRWSHRQKSSTNCGARSSTYPLGREQSLLFVQKILLVRKWLHRHLYT